MPVYNFYPDKISESARIMLFVDGENLACSYGRFLKDHKITCHEWNKYWPGHFLWRKNFATRAYCPSVWRTYYYTSVVGDTDKLQELVDTAKSCGIEAPRIFSKVKNEPRKQVDIQLTTDLLLNAVRRNFDVAIVVTQDQDFVPVIQAVQLEGRLVVLWHMGELSQKLKSVADFDYDVSGIFVCSRI